MPKWLIDITSFIQVPNDSKPNEREVRNYIKEETSQIMNNIIWVLRKENKCGE